MGSSGRCIHYIYKNIGIRGTSIAEFPVPCIFLRLLDLIFLDDFLALDHTAAAVCALILSLLAHSAAVGAVGIVLDLCTCDLLSAGFCSKPCSSCDPSNKPDDEHDREDKHQEDRGKADQGHKDGLKRGKFVVAAACAGRTGPGLALRHKAEGIIRVNDGHGILVPR